MIQLIDATGRVIVANKKGFINNDLPDILDRLGIDGITWTDEINQFKTKVKKAIGTLEKLKQYIKNIKNKIKFDISLNPVLESGITSLLFFYSELG